ncbi:MAG: hypothetical protein WDO15_06645 [Bacteroidota bacterium]
MARELNIAVPVQYGNIAIEVNTSSEKAERLFATGLFKARFKASVDREFQGKLSKEEKAIIDQWNTRFYCIL